MFRNSVCQTHILRTERPKKEVDYQALQIEHQNKFSFQRRLEVIITLLPLPLEYQDILISLHTFATSGMNIFTLTEHGTPRVMRYWMVIKPGYGILSSASDGLDNKYYQHNTWFRHVDFVHRFGSTYTYYRYYDGEKVEESTLAKTNPYVTYNSSYLSIGYNPENPYNFVNGYVKDWTVCSKYLCIMLWFCVYKPAWR